MCAVHRPLAALVAAGISFLAMLATAPSASAAEVVAFNGDSAPGTIVVRTKERRLYFVLGQGRALRYTGPKAPRGNEPQRRNIHPSASFSSSTDSVFARSFPRAHAGVRFCASAGTTIPRAHW